jgi:hypothetical protein
MCLEVFPNISFPTLADPGKLGATEFMNPVPPDFSWVLQICFSQELTILFLIISCSFSSHKFSCMHESLNASR